MCIHWPADQPLTRCCTRTAWAPGTIVPLLSLCSFLIGACKSHSKCCASGSILLCATDLAHFVSRLWSAATAAFCSTADRHALQANPIVLLCGSPASRLRQRAGASCCATLWLSRLPGQDLMGQALTQPGTRCAKTRGISALKASIQRVFRTACI